MTGPQNITETHEPNIPPVPPDFQTVWDERMAALRALTVAIDALGVIIVNTDTVDPAMIAREAVGVIRETLKCPAKQ